MISIIIPAYNEEKYLPKTLACVAAALRSGVESELIVVDNESTDATAKMAASFGAVIVTEAEHNIAKVRNTGGAHASGDVLVFIDADTSVAPGVFEKIVGAMSDPACHGGSVAVEYERLQRRRLLIAFFMRLWTFLARFTKMRQGALQFCRADVFRELGGYDTTIYVGEDIEFGWRLDALATNHGGFTAFIEEPKVETSSRRWGKMGLIRMIFFTHPVTIFLMWRTPWIWKDWYRDVIR